MATLAECGWAVFPGGSLGEYGPPAGLTAVLARGEGTTVWDTHGWAVLDCTMGWGAVLLGHAPPAATEAARRQAARGADFADVSAPARKLHEALATVRADCR